MFRNIKIVLCVSIKKTNLDDILFPKEGHQEGEYPWTCPPSEMLRKESKSEKMGTYKILIPTTNFLLRNLLLS
jgi:hypothetical protein